VRVLFLSWRDTSHPDGGGSEVYVEQVAAGLAARGHDVTILCAKHPGAADVSVRDGIRIVRRGGRLTVYLWGLTYLLSPAGRRTDVVVDVINGLPFATPLVRRRGLVALVHHLHREQWRIIYPGWAGRLGWFVESRVVPRLYRRVPFVTVSAASRRDLLDLGVERVCIVHNGTPPLPRHTVPRSATPRLCVLARLVPHKRIEQAIALVGDLRVRHPGLLLDLVGDGWWADQLDAEIAARGLGDVVVRHGRVDEQTKADLLGQAWLMVLPSVREGWGIAVLEAAATGTPTVAYLGAGGTAEAVVDGVTGVLVADEAQLRETVDELLGDPARLASMGTAAQERAATFTWAEATDGLEKVLGSESGAARSTGRTRARPARRDSGRDQRSSTARARRSPGTPEQHR
jgi:glycosyltransferase involved in cell wall biosynthesis